MQHIDYSSGLIPWEDLQGITITPYTCTDNQGRVVEVTPKHLGAHSSWEQIQADPAYHFNLGSVLLEPDKVRTSTSQNPAALQHQDEGEVLIYSKDNYIMSLNAPSSPQYRFSSTEVVVKYTDDGNFTLTNIIQRRIGG